MSIESLMPSKHLILCRPFLLLPSIFPASGFFSNESALCISSVQSLSHIWLFATPWTTAHHASLSITNSWSLPKPMSIELMMSSNHLILCHPLLLLPSIFPRIRVFSNESALLIRWPECQSFRFSISPSSEHPGLISFRMDWLDLLTVQGTLKSLLQHHSSKASILWCSTYFIVQFSHQYMTEKPSLWLYRTTELCWQSNRQCDHQQKKAFPLPTSIRVWVVRVRWSKMDHAWK